MENKDALYARWLSGEISDDELRSIEGEAALAELKRVREATDKWSMPKYDSSAGYEKFKQKHQAPPAKIRKLNWFAIGGIAASFLVIAFFGITYFTNQNEVLFAENGQNQTVELSNGSAIWLNDGSTVEYNARNWENQRAIELTGEALFEVTKGSSFIVNTKNGSIRVLGTQFNVRAWGDNLYVECYEGRVEVTANKQEVVLTANESVNVVEGKMSEKKSISNTAPFWQNLTSRFYEEQLEDVFEELERQFDVKVNRIASDRSFSGSFGHQDVEKALRSICKPLGLQFTISEDKKVVEIE